MRLFDQLFVHDKNYQLLVMQHVMQHVGAFAIWQNLVA